MSPFRYCLYKSSFKVKRGWVWRMWAEAVQKGWFRSWQAAVLQPGEQQQFFLLCMLHMQPNTGAEAHAAAPETAARRMLLEPQITGLDKLHFNCDHESRLDVELFFKIDFYFFQHLQHQPEHRNVSVTKWQDSKNKIVESQPVWRD